MKIFYKLTNECENVKMSEKESSLPLMSQLMKTCSEKNIPAVVQIELTNKCNLSCRHCNFIRSDGPDLTTAEVKGIIDQLKEAGTFYLAFTGGEIFTRKDFLEIAEYAKKEGFLLIFMTNATLITPEIVEAIKMIGPRNLEISLLGATPETHDHITQVMGSFDRTVEAIKALTSAGIDVITKTALMSLNFREYEDIRELSKSLGAVPMVSPTITPRKDGSRAPQNFLLPFEDLEDYLPSAPSDPGSAARSTCCISPSGDVFPCVLLPIKLGNLREQSFKELWRDESNEELSRIRSLEVTDLTECSSCASQEFCYRCAGVAYLETGSYTAPSPSACRQANLKKRLEKMKT
jgi:radical SAM protein with 4Fe4S-binding SPASM domain